MPTIMPIPAAEWVKQRRYQLLFEYQLNPSIDRAADLILFEIKVKRLREKGELDGARAVTAS